MMCRKSFFCSDRHKRGFDPSHHFDLRAPARRRTRVRILLPLPHRSKLYIACSEFFLIQSALMPLLLLSKSKPLRWASIWFSVQI